VASEGVPHTGHGDDTGCQSRTPPMVMAREGAGDFETTVEHAKGMPTGRIETRQFST
jgi:hypothetical protein